jgi:hypothetical protein
MEFLFSYSAKLWVFFKKSAWFIFEPKRLLQLALIQHFPVAYKPHYHFQEVDKSQDTLVTERILPV